MGVVEGCTAAAWEAFTAGELTLAIVAVVTMEVIAEDMVIAAATTAGVAGMGAIRATVTDGASDLDGRIGVGATHTEDTTATALGVTLPILTIITRLVLQAIHALTMEMMILPLPIPIQNPMTLLRNLGDRLHPEALRTCTMTPVARWDLSQSRGFSQLTE
jgi:hypothetical protein